MIRFLYNLLFPVALLLFLPGYLVKMVRRGNYRDGFGQRLGWYGADLRRRLQNGGARTWLHAVSVGEVGVALSLADEQRGRDPAFACVLTVTTTTGHAVARRRAPAWMEVIYAPLDFWPVMRRAFEVIQPRSLILVEAEVWPNMMAEAQRRDVPVLLANARLSPRSEKRFRRFRPLVAPLFQRLQAIGVTSPEDVERWQSLGVPADRITVTGNIKFDTARAVTDPELPHAVLAARGFDPARPVLLGGSTHPGEERILGETWQRLRARVPNLFLVIAPRHVERAGRVAQRLQELSLRVARRSEETPLAGEVDCLILDVTGELRHWYALATVAFIGKSLTARGGQNPIEPILAGVPVVFGPHMENFAFLAGELVKRGAAVRVAEAAELAGVMEKLFEDAAGRARMVAAAHEILVPHRGATEKTAVLHEKMLPSGSSGTPTGVVS